MSEFYKATSSKNPDFNYTEEVIFEKDGNGNVARSIKVGGEAVALSEEELASARKYLNVRTATDEERQAAEGDTEAPQSESVDAEAAEQQTSTAAQVNPPNSPAAEDAKTEAAKGSRRGGDK